MWNINIFVPCFVCVDNNTFYYLRNNNNKYNLILLIPRIKDTRRCRQFPFRKEPGYDIPKQETFLTTMNLPPELWLCIFAFLGSLDLFAITDVSPAFAAICKKSIILNDNTKYEVKHFKYLTRFRGISKLQFVSVIPYDHVFFTEMLRDLTMKWSGVLRNNICRLKNLKTLTLTLTKCWMQSDYELIQNLTSLSDLYITGYQESRFQSDRHFWRCHLEEFFNFQLPVNLKFLRIERFQQIIVMPSFFTLTSLTWLEIDMLC